MTGSCILVFGLRASARAENWRLKVLPLTDWCRFTESASRYPQICRTPQAKAPGVCDKFVGREMVKLPSR